MLGDLDVLAHGEVGHEVVELKDESQLAAAVFGEALLAEAFKLRGAHTDAARVCRLQAAHQVQKRRLARTRGSQQYADLAFFYVARHVAQNRLSGFSLAIALAETLNAQVCLVRHASDRLSVVTNKL